MPDDVDIRLSEIDDTAKSIALRISTIDRKLQRAIYGQLYNLKTSDEDKVKNALDPSLTTLKETLYNINIDLLSIEELVNKLQNDKVDGCA